MLVDALPHERHRAYERPFLVQRFRDEPHALPEGREHHGARVAVGLSVVRALTLSLEALLRKVLDE